MKFDELIASYVAGTTLDPAMVKLFLQTPAHYHQWGIHHQIDQTALEQLKATDLFEFYLRLFLVSRHKTLQPVLREVRAFVNQDATTAHYFIRYSLESTRQHLLTMEWYELLPRLETARARILPLTPAIDYRLQPQVVSLLEESY